eukprot:4245988-Prymnesium_polylepis.1
MVGAMLVDALGVRRTALAALAVAAVSRADASRLAPLIIWQAPCPNMAKQVRHALSMLSTSKATLP